MANPKYKTEHLLLLLQKINSLEGTNDEKGNFVPFVFGEDESTRWNLAKDHEIVESVGKHVDKRRMAKIKELSPVNNQITAEPVPVQVEFNEWYQALLEEEIEVPGFLTIPKANISNGGKNKIAPSTLKVLLPFLT